MKPAAVNVFRDTSATLRCSESVCENMCVIIQLEQTHQKSHGGSRINRDTHGS